MRLHLWYNLGKISFGQITVRFGQKKTLSKARRTPLSCPQLSSTINHELNSTP
jgi:hypothetical protein